MKLSLVVVCHHSGEVLPVCVASFRREAARLGADAEVIVLEQSESPAEVAAVRDCGADRLLVRSNAGYAAGLNAGAAAATGSVLLLANPDVELLAGSLEALLGALDAGAAVAGPQLVWDRAASLLLPVPEDPSPRAELRRALRRCSARSWRAGLDDDIEACWRVWRSSGPTAVACLRGPLLVLERSTWDRLGPLDEGYFLYFEETEWLWRAHRRGLRLVLVGNARVVHAWGHSTRRRADRERIEHESRRRFRRRNHPWLARFLVRRLEARRQRAGVSARPVAGLPDVPPTDALLWLLSPFRHLIPVAGCLGGLSPAVGDLARKGRWFLAAARRDQGRWRILGSWTWGQP